MVAVLPGVWRWADGAQGHRCGTALRTPQGLVLIDPPPLDAGARGALEGEAGAVRHVLLTHTAQVPLGAPFRAAGALVWAPGAGADVEGVDRTLAPGDPLPGGLLVCQLPQDAAPGEVAFFWEPAGEGLLITGDAFPVVGQVPVYLEGEAPAPPLYAGLVRALLAMEPGTLAPGRQAPPAPAVMYATGYAAHIGRPFHQRRAAPVEGPRFLVPQAGRILEEALLAPVVLRRPAGSGGPWLADPQACIRCGQATSPAVQTCGGPFIPRLCPACRAAERGAPPALRVMACAGGCCTRAGARAVLSALRQAVAARGLSGEVDVVPVSCLGECGIGPLVGVQTARGQEPPGATAFRRERDARLRQFAADEDEEIDEASERVLARFTALVQPAEAPELIERLPAPQAAPR
jgi:hypothetical protein